MRWCTKTPALPLLRIPLSLPIVPSTPVSPSSSSSSSNGGGGDGNSSGNSNTITSTISRSTRATTLHPTFHAGGTALACVAPVVVSVCRCNWLWVGSLFSSSISRARRATLRSAIYSHPVRSLPLPPPPPPTQSPSAPTPTITLPLAVSPSRVRVARPSEILKAVRACATRGWRGTENRGERKLRGSGLRVSPRADVCRPCPLACMFYEREKFIHTRARTHIHIITRIHTRVYFSSSWIRVYNIRVSWICWRIVNIFITLSNHFLSLRPFLTPLREGRVFATRKSVIGTAFLHRATWRCGDVRSRGQFSKWHTFIRERSSRQRVAAAKRTV